MKKFKVFILLILFLSSALLISSCAKDPDDNPPVNNFETEVQVLVDSVRTADGVAGISVYARNTHGEVAWVASGQSNKEENIPLLKDTKFRIASISKPFLSVVTLQLMEEGAFNLEDKFAEYLPDSLVNLFEYGHEVSIFQLLGHTSGLYDFEDDQFIDILLNDMQHHWTPWELLQYSITADSSVAHPPGSQYHYSNTNYIVLALLVEEVTGVSLEDNIRNRILSPLNLTNTYNGGLEAIPQENCADGYHPVSENDFLIINEETLPLYFEWSHGHMVSSVNDLAVFFEALSKNELFQEQTTLDAMLTWSELSEHTYGLGISIISLDLGWGHGGATLGFLSIVAINPETGTLLVACINQYHEGIWGSLVPVLCDELYE